MAWTHDVLRIAYSLGKRTLASFNIGVSHDVFVAQIRDIATVREALQLIIKYQKNLIDLNIENKKKLLKIQYHQLLNIIQRDMYSKCLIKII